TAQTGQLLPVLSAVARAEDGSVFHTGENRVGIGQRWLEMPHSLELPRMLGAVVPLMRGQRFGGRVISEFVALAFGRARFCRLASRRSRLMPGLASVVRALDQLPEPAARL